MSAERKDEFVIIITGTATINSNAYIAGPIKHITSDAHIKTAYSNTVNSNYFIKKLGTEETLNSNSSIKKLGYEKTITSDSCIAKVSSSTITCDGFLLGPWTKTIDSDSYIKQNYGNHALRTGFSNLVSLYHMDEPSWSGVPNEVIDSKGSNEGQAMGVATTIQGGIFARAGSFSGTDTGVNCGNDSTFHTNTLSISTWIYPTAASNDYNDIVNAGLYSVTIRSTKYVEFWIYTANEGWITAKSDSTIELNKWYLITATYDDSTAKLYIDSTLQSTTASGNGSIPWGTQTTYIAQSGANTNEYTGRIDDLAIWNTALDQDAISNIWKEFTLINSNAFIAKVGEGSLNSNYFITKISSETITSDSIIETTSPETFNSDYYIKKLGITNTVNCDEHIIIAPKKTIDSNYSITKLGISKTLNSNYNIRILGTESSIASDSWIGEVNSNTLDSNYSITKAYSNTLSSDMQVKNIIEGAINSDYYIKKLASDGSINSDAYIKKVETSETITCDGFIILTSTLEINSDYNIKKLGIDKTIDSNYSITKTYSQTIDSDYHIFKAGEGSLTSDYTIKKFAYEESINSNLTVMEYGDWSEEWEVNIVIPITKTINSNYSITKTYSETINSDSYVKGKAYEGSIVSDYYIHRTYEKNINANICIRRTDTTKPDVCIASYINKPVIVSANSLSYAVEAIATHYHPRKIISSNCTIT